MNPPRYLTAIFCDDVRREEGHKLSYMGVYTGVLGVPSFPSVLPRLCFAVTMTVAPKAIPSELRFRLYKNDEMLTETEVPREALAAAQTLNPADDQVVQFGTIFQLFPVQLTQACFFRIRAVCDGPNFAAGPWPLWNTIRSPQERFRSTSAKIRYCLGPQIQWRRFRFPSTPFLTGGGKTTGNCGVQRELGRFATEFGRGVQGSHRRALTLPETYPNAFCSPVGLRKPLI